MKYSLYINLKLLERKYTSSSLIIHHNIMIGNSIFHNHSYRPSFSLLMAFSAPGMLKYLLQNFLFVKHWATLSTEACTPPMQFSVRHLGYVQTQDYSKWQTPWTLHWNVLCFVCLRANSFTLGLQSGSSSIIRHNWLIFRVVYNSVMVIALFKLRRGSKGNSTIGGKFHEDSGMHYIKLVGGWLSRECSESSSPS